MIMTEIIDKFEDEYAFLSNFYNSPFVFEDISYPTNEHFFQAMKTSDIDIRKQIASCSTPGKAKRMGRSVALDLNWERIKMFYMYVGLQQKFFQNKEIREKLLDTGDAYLIEGNTWHDNIWGNCTCNRCKKITGQNKLGKLLMKLRDEIREKERNGDTFENNTTNISERSNI